MHRLHAAAWLLLPVVAGFVATPRVAPASTWLPPAVRARGGGGAATSRVVTMMGRRGTLRPKDSESKRQGRVAQLVRNELADIVRKGKNVKAVQGKPLDPRLCEKAREDALRFSLARVVVEPPPAFASPPHPAVAGAARGPERRRDPAIRALPCRPRCPPVRAARRPRQRAASPVLLLRLLPPRSALVVSRFTSSFCFFTCDGRRQRARDREPSARSRRHLS